jgi:hypothetical protein
MARMTREFSLVLLGSGILTTGYFLYPEEDLQAKQDEEINKQVASNNNHHHRSHLHGPGFIFIPTGGFMRGGGNGNVSRPIAGGHISRGGIGGIGRGSASS